MFVSKRLLRIGGHITLYGLCWSLAAATAQQPPSPVAAPHAPLLTPAPGPKQDMLAKSLAPIGEADANIKNEQIISHLNSVVRYYHACRNPVQRVGEPSDSIYEDKLESGAKEVATYAFQFGTAAATILNVGQKHSVADNSTGPSEDSLLEGILAEAEKQVQVSKVLKQLLESQSKGSHGQASQVLHLQSEVADGVVQLNTAMAEATTKVLSMSDAQGRSVMVRDIEHLQRTLPELSDRNAKVANPPATSLSGAKAGGIVSQISALLGLLSTRRSIDQLLASTKELHQQALELRNPLTDQVKLTYGLGQQLSRQAANLKTDYGSEDAQVIQERLVNIRLLTDKFEKLSTAGVPLYEEIIVLEESRANLMAWHAAVEAEYKSILTSLLLRIVVITVILLVLFAAGEAWRRATIRYVHDQRRRRQLLGLRKTVVGFLSVLVVLFGCVTQFNSLATFAGFITAGLAVGLQTILLSVAAYFFIVGKYGIRVGDRITVSGVTGEVIDVDLIRFYLMELAGAGTDLPPTGRVAVFSNAVLFQAGTPLYKQMPGTDYAWHEMSVTLQASEYGGATEIIHKEVEQIFAEYRNRIELQHSRWETSMEMKLRTPTVESTVQLIEQQLKLLVRFPVQLRDAEAVDQKVSEMMVRLMNRNETVKQAVTVLPTIKASASVK
jgi:small-conductance mechanosensitive channel